ncbi:class I SAM-dependent methyltransferase [Antribacter gilvus]|uniref:class I SAM-dependent methyltransferase n=1 Tax=Antribacter gilvus TaxID=2304675 RepID=UPI000F7ABE74|nr:class I SAM-dependent methyltransferase [Antribacter gilvus]
MDGAEPDRWSDVADEWARLWGGFAEPAWDVVVAASGVGAGARVLDVGCGSGDLLAYLDRRGMSVAGIDPAPGMVSLARARVPAAEVRQGDAEHLPWGDAAFDLVTSVNALQFADDVDDALAELVRVVGPGGQVAVANWAEGRHNDLDVIEQAVARAREEEPLPDGDLREPGGLEELFADGGLEVVASGLVEVPWRVPGDDALVRGVLLGEEADVVAELAPVVLAASARFLAADGGYVLRNHFRYAVGRAAG